MTADIVSAEDTDSILTRTAKGAGWVIGWRMLTRALGMISTLFLARLLLPADFGLVTLAAGFAQAVDQLCALGVEEAVIREKQPSRDLYDSAFTINVLRGAATAAVVAAAALPVARFFDDSRLYGLMLVFAAGALVASFENIGIVDFRRDITFHKEFILMVMPRLVSIVVAISLAFLFHSYWALACAILVAIVLRVVMGYVMHPFRARFRLVAWRQIAGFSFWSWLLSLAELLRERSDSFVIGRVFDMAQVGIFSLGFEIAAMPTTELISPLSRACFSGFAAARSGGATEAEAGTAFLRVVGVTTLIALPAGVGISLVADPIVQLAFGAKWAAATGVIQVLGVALTTAVLGYVSVAMMTAHAMLKPMLRMQALALAVKLVLLIVLVTRFGLLGAAVAVGLAATLLNFLYVVATGRFLRLRPAGLLGVTWRSLAGTAVMAAGLVGCRLGWTGVAGSDLAIIGDLALAIGFGAVLYAATVVLCWLAAGRPAGAERDVLALARKVMPRPAITA